MSTATITTPATPILSRISYSQHGPLGTIISTAFRLALPAYVHDPAITHKMIEQVQLDEGGHVYQVWDIKATAGGWLACFLTLYKVRLDGSIWETYTSTLTAKKAITFGTWQEAEAPTAEQFADTVLWAQTNELSE